MNAYWEIFFSEKVPPDPVELEPLVRGKYYQEGLPQDLLFRVMMIKKSVTDAYIITITLSLMEIK